MVTTIISVWVPDLNVIVSAVTLILLVVFGPRLYKAQDAKARLAVKDQTIDTQKQAIESRDDRIEGLLGDLGGCKLRAEQAEALANDREHEATDLRARYDEMSKYSAPEAFTKLSEVLDGQGKLIARQGELMQRHIDNVQHRHEKMLEILGMIVAESTAGAQILEKINGEADRKA